MCIRDSLGYGLEKIFFGFFVLLLPGHDILSFFCILALGSLLLILVAHDLMNTLQTFQQNRIEGAALSVQDHLKRRIMGIGLLIDSLADLSLIHISSHHRPCPREKT